LFIETFREIREHDISRLEPIFRNPNGQRLRIFFNIVDGKGPILMFILHHVGIGIVRHQGFQIVAPGRLFHRGALRGGGGKRTPDDAAHCGQRQSSRQERQQFHGHLLVGRFDFTYKLPGVQYGNYQNRALLLL
jgi:hypothetical protein